jgi:hypothetical protein
VLETIELPKAFLAKDRGSEGGRVDPRVAYTEINNPSLNLAACRARLSDPCWPSAYLSLGPVCISDGTHRRVRLTLAFRGERRFSFPAQFLHAGTYRREVVGSTRSVHVLLPLA